MDVNVISSWNKITKSGCRLVDQALQKKNNKKAAKLVIKLDDSIIYSTVLLYLQTGPSFCLAVGSEKSQFGSLSLPAYHLRPGRRTDLKKKPSQVF